MVYNLLLEKHFTFILSLNKQIEISYIQLTSALTAQEIITIIIIRDYTSFSFNCTILRNMHQINKYFQQNINGIDAVNFFTSTSLGVGEGGNFQVLNSNLHFLLQIWIDYKKLSEFTKRTFFILDRLFQESKKFGFSILYSENKHGTEISRNMH